MLKHFIRLACLPLFLSMIAMPVPAVRADEDGEVTVTGKVQKLSPASNQVVLTLANGNERVIQISDVTTVQIAGKIKPEDILSPAKVDNGAVLKRAFGEEATMSFRTDRPLNGLRPGDEVTVQFVKKSNRLVASRILAWRNAAKN